MCQNREIGQLSTCASLMVFVRNLCVKFCKLGVGLWNKSRGDGCMFLGSSVVVCFHDHELGHRSCTLMFDLVLHFQGASQVL